MQVIWSRRAIADLKKIDEYIGADNPPAAKQQLKLIRARERQIAAYPFSGRAIPEYQDENLREMLEGNYRIFYEIRTQRIEILAIYHQSQLI